MVNAKILQLIREAAEEGDAFAQFEVALDFDYGTSAEQDFQQASTWYDRAARQGHKSAESNLLLQHVLGQASILHPSVVFNKLKLLAEAGDRDAQNNLGLCFQLAYGTDQNHAEAANWFDRAARSGSPNAQFNLGGAYYEGKGAPKNLERAIEWYTRAAEQRDELALLMLGYLYRKGIGVQVDARRALTLFSTAYRRGSARAANHLAFMFKKGIGVERDDAVAYQLYLECVSTPDTPEAHEKLDYRGTAYYWLGYMAEHAEGVDRDLRLARRWYSRGAACAQVDCVKALARLRAIRRKCRT